ncbi:MAG: bifunctional hydroxymethylpyrimidine kinase/phosphomethylpyrimidine kinase [Desulfobulbaceae bacterium]|nr:bifunctional hydroxymethylpyrimidine kinase/phosphomethylpyrimidine kinase [Desulfobulbaceae bacterium]
MTHQQTRAILTIAGSDPSGGAGIQADLKTFTVLSTYGCAVITSLTVQNTLGVLDCHPLAPELVHQQIAAVLDDMTVSHIKIGMIGSADIGSAICHALKCFTGEVIYDPVIYSSVGQPIRTTDTLEGVHQLAARATALTPNLQELGLLTGQNIGSTTEALVAGKKLLAVFPKLKAVAIKGGHLNPDLNQVTDTLLLAEDDQPLFRSHPRIISRNTHGTGCTFASALAAFHQHSGDYSEAFQRSIDFLNFLLAASVDYRLGHGNGGLCHHLYRHNE